MLPPGDLRNCMVALTEDEATPRPALPSSLSRRRRPRKATASATSSSPHWRKLPATLPRPSSLHRKILATRGHIYPATTANAPFAPMDDGMLCTRRNQHHRQQTPNRPAMLEPPEAEPLCPRHSKPWNAPTLSPSVPVLFTPVSSPTCWLRHSGSAGRRLAELRVFICNLMTQANESLGLTASEHIERIYEHTGARHLRLRHREHRAIFT